MATKKADTTETEPEAVDTRAAEIEERRRRKEEATTVDGSEK